MEQEEVAKIKLIQSPIIRHNLVDMGKNVSERLIALNLENQVATEDTLKTLKDMRAELNKEKDEFEEQRKAVKKAINAPYDEFEKIYKSEITDKYKSADETLRGKINEFELKVKQEKGDKLTAYFDELCAVEKLDWLRFEKLGIEVNLSTTLKKYKEQVLAEIEKIKDGINLISTEKHAAEILVEYKTSLNASQAIQLIKQRKQKEKEESDRILFERSRKRVDSIRKLQFVSHELTRTYNWVIDESVMVKIDEVENLSDEEWQKKYLELELAAKAKTKEEIKPQILQAPTISAPAPTPKARPEVKEEIFEAKFLVTGTFAEIKALGVFMKANNYKYQNID